MMLSAVKVVLIPVLAGILLYRLFPKQIDSIRDVLPLVSIVSIVMIISGIVGGKTQKNYDLWSFNICCCYDT